jgi:hypothetical protein
MSNQRTATFGPVEGDPATWIVRCDASINHIVGRFAVARLDRGRHGFVMAVEHVDLFRTFARLNRIELSDPIPVTVPATWTPPAYVPGHNVGRQDEINKRGVALCRLILMRSRLRKARPT